MKRGRAKQAGRKSAKRRLPVMQIVGIVLGLGLLISPIALDLAETWRNSQAVSSMSDTASAQDDARLQEVLDQAHAYNAKLAGKLEGEAAQAVLPYDQQLAWNADGAISWLEIPSLSLKLPGISGDFRGDALLGNRAFGGNVPSRGR